jgi:hypothetical protein
MEPRDRMGKTHVGRLITLSFIVLLGAGLRFYGIARESLWMDEATTVRCADLALSEIWSQPCDTSPPLYYALQRAWLLFGRSEAALRSLSAVVATLSILITYALGRHLAGTGAGLLRCSRWQMRTRLMPDVDCNWKGCPGRLAVTTGSPSSFSGLPWLWSQPRALCVPGSSSMTRKRIPSAASARSCSCRRRWRSS